MDIDGIEIRSKTRERKKEVIAKETGKNTKSTQNHNLLVF
jgi:hypothetical protein